MNLLRSPRLASFHADVVDAPRALASRRSSFAVARLGWLAAIAALGACSTSVDADGSSDGFRDVTNAEPTTPPGSTPPKTTPPKTTPHGASDPDPTHPQPGPSGALDATFGASGTLKVNYYDITYRLPPLDVALDSRIYIGSYAAGSGASPSAAGLGRLSPAGALEPGAFVPDGTGGLTAVQLALAEGGAVYYLATSRGQPHEYSTLRRFVSGAVDTTFGQNGYMNLQPPPKPFGGSRKGGVDFVRMGDHLYVLLSFASTTPGSRAFGVARVSSGGQLDATFGTAGVATVTTSSPLAPSGPGGIELDASGRIYVPGSKDGGAVIARLDASGAVDTSFGTMGYATAGFDAAAIGSGIAKLPGGGFVLSAVVADSDVGLARFDASGALVPSFGNGGSVRLERAGEQRPIFNAVHHDPAGRVVVVSSVPREPVMDSERWIDRIWL